MKTADLSICIVAYRNYAQIRRAVSSICDHTAPTLSKTLYIVDNSADSAEAAAFREYLQGCPDTVYLPAQTNLGFGKGHNAVLPLLNSRYHAIVNPDIEINEDVFSAIARYMDREANVSMVIPRIIDQEGNLQSAYRQDPTVFDMFIRMFCKGLFQKRQAMHTLQDKNYGEPFPVPFAQGCFLVVRTDVFRQLGGFDERYFMYMEDVDLCRRINAGSSVMYYPGATVTHAWEKGSHKSLKLLKIHVTSMLRYFRKWGWKLF